jgi:hypothetical protein
MIGVSLILAFATLIAHWIFTSYPSPSYISRCSPHMYARLRN